MRRKGTFSPRLGYEEDVIKRVCYLVGHHHTYQDIEGLDYQILVEADFLVNLYENGSSKETAREVLYRVFVTESGKDILRNMFLFFWLISAILLQTSL